MLYRPGLDEMSPYSIDRLVWSVKLDANEKPTDLPPRIKQQVVAKLADLDVNRYPDMGMTNLRQIIGQTHGLTSEQVLIGNGSSELLAALCRAFGGSGRSIIYPTPSFSMYSIYVKLADAMPVPVQLSEDFSMAPQMVLSAAASSKAKLIILCNPNNPTGNVMPLADIEKIVANAPCPVVVDEAYYEFYGCSALSLLAKYKQLIIVRTFSKAYGLAAARVGYMLAESEITSAVAKTLLPYHVNAFSLVTAETVYALRGEFTADIEFTKSERNRLTQALSAFSGLIVYPSETNFLLVKLLKAKELAKFLAAQGIGIRDFSSAPGLIDCLRISIGTSQENDAILAAIGRFSKG